MDPLEQRIAKLERQMASLKNAAQIDPDIVYTLGLSYSQTSGKTVASETQAVVEAGSATYNVQKVPDKYIKIGDVHVPAYTS